MNNNDLTALALFLRSLWPLGYPHQALSARMYIFAYRCVAEEKVTLLA
jgi:hypothetical protein